MQSPSIPRTKLRPPLLRQPVVPRPHLTDLFDQEVPLTLISAPAGSGKTTLARAWLVSGPSEAAWLSRDASDVMMMENRSKEEAQHAGTEPS